MRAAVQKASTSLGLSWTGRTTGSSGPSACAAPAVASVATASATPSASAFPIRESVDMRMVTFRVGLVVREPGPRVFASTGTPARSPGCGVTTPPVRAGLGRRHHDVGRLSIADQASRRRDHAHDLGAVEAQELVATAAPLHARVRDRVSDLLAVCRSASGPSTLSSSRVCLSADPRRPPPRGVASLGDDASSGTSVAQDRRFADATGSSAARDHHDAGLAARLMPAGQLLAQAPARGPRSAARRLIDSRRAAPAARACE